MTSIRTLRRTTPRPTTPHRRRSTAGRRQWSFGTMRLAQAIVATITALRATVGISIYINIITVAGTMETLLTSKRRCIDPPKACPVDSLLSLFLILFYFYFIIIIIIYLFIHIFLTCFSILIFVVVVFSFSMTYSFILLRYFYFLRISFESS